MSAQEAHPDVVAALAAIRWTSSPVPWPSARPVLDVAIEALPYIESDFVADVVEQLAMTIVDVQDELSAVLAVLSESLALAHTQHQEIIRLSRVYHGALDALHQLRQQARQAV